MNPPSLICLSLTPNLRCVGFTLGQVVALIIPPAIEVIISLSFIYSYSGPGGWAQVLLVADSILYFILALLDMLSRVVLAMHTSLSVFRTLDYLIGAVSFTPILLYSFYLYRLSLRDFIPTLSRKLRPYPKFSLPILVTIAVAVNEVSSFVPTYIGTVFNRPVDDGSPWFSLSQSSLMAYTIVQLLFFLLAFSRLFGAFLDQRRIELTHSDEHHYFNGIAWIAAGIIIGIIETIAGLTQVSFDVALARRILRSIGRAVLMFGMLKGLDAAESFENLVDELRGVSRMNRHVSYILGIDPQRNTSRPISQSYSEQSQVDGCSIENQPRGQRVTVHYEKGQAPFLQIRFSTLDFPAPTILADMIQQRRRSLSGLIPGYTGAGTSTSLHGEMAAARNAVLETQRAKSALVTAVNNYDVPPDWIRPPEGVHTRQRSGGTISDSLSVVRDLERRFPNIPPRVTGKYRGSILGENYEEDPFPVVGVSRQSSLRHDGGVHNPSEEGEVSATLHSNGSIKRKPAPPLLEDISRISDQHECPASTWGGLTAEDFTTQNNPRKGATPRSPGSTQAGEPDTPRRRRTTARNVIRRASRALSDASIHSAEWFASASSPGPVQTPLTATDVGMYRRGTLGPGSARLTSVGEAPKSGRSPLSKANRKSTEDDGTHSKLNQTCTSVRI